MPISPPPSPHNKITVTRKTKKKPLKSNKKSTKIPTEGFPTIPTDKFCKVKSEVEVSKDEASNSHLQSKKVVKGKATSVIDIFLEFFHLYYLGFIKMIFCELFR